MARKALGRGVYTEPGLTELFLATRCLWCQRERPEDVSCSQLEGRQVWLKEGLGAGVP